MRCSSGPFGYRVELFFPAYLGITRLQSESNYCPAGTTLFLKIYCATQLKQTCVKVTWDIYKQAWLGHVLCDWLWGGRAKAALRSGGTNIRQAVFGSDGTTGACVMKAARDSSSFILGDSHHCATLSKSRAHTHFLTANTFSAKRGMWSQ